METIQSILSVQENWSGDALIDWMDAHTEVPVFAVSVYLGIIFQVPQLLKDSKPFALRAPFAIWNFVLAAFSIVGSYYTVPKLLSALWENGFHYTVCQDPKADFYFNGAAGLWVALFILSKIPELLDTVFLVLQKKPVIFLHWFHHVTVMLYCWHAYRQRMSNGLWFAAMNFFVHSIMYSYYFFMAINMKKLVKPIAPVITSLQLLQMVMGMVVTLAAFVFHVPGDLSACHAESSNIKMGLAMYSSYFVLFALLFKKLYLSGDRGARGGAGRVAGGTAAPPAGASGAPAAAAAAKLRRLDIASAENEDADDDICAVAGLAINRVDDIVSSPRKSSKAD